MFKAHILIKYLLLLVLATISWLYVSKPNTPSDPLSPLISNPDTGPVAEFLFQEMTIPFLSNRDYSSNLTIGDVFEDKSAYTSYFATYESDGLAINGLLTRPKGEQPARGWPAIVFLHGYIPPTQYRTLQNYVSYIEQLASSGFVVFKIDLRGHDQSEGEPGGAYYSSDYIVDTLNAKAALSSSRFVNPDTIGLWGHSMAGNVIFRALASSSDIPAIVIWAGAVYTYEDFSEYSISDNSYRPPVVLSERRRKRDLLFETYGSFDPNSAFWKQVPGTNYLDSINGAIQIHHAINDSIVDIRYSQGLNTILDSTSIPHEYYDYASGGHNITGNSYSQAMDRTVEFFTQYLK